MNRPLSRFVPLALLALTLSACDDVAGPDDRRATLSIGFTTPAAFAAQEAGGTTSARQTADELILEGDNGTLTITDIRLVVSELELEGDDVCEEDDDLGPFGDDECEFEAGPFLLDLPLGPLADGEVVLATGEIPLGTYTELEWEVEDLDLDDEDDVDDVEDRDFAERLAEIRSELRTLYPEIPDQATMVIAGTFTPTGGEARSFTVYFDAEIEVETPLVPPLVVDEEGASRELTVVLDPAVWLTDGADVVDLSQLDGRLVEFEAEFEGGVVDVETDDDEDDDEEDD